MLKWGKYIFVIDFLNLLLTGCCSISEDKITFSSVSTSTSSHFHTWIISLAHFFSCLHCSTSLSPLFADPATCPIVPGQETVIEISKGRSGLGLSIVGGKDTQLVWDTPALFLLINQVYGPLSQFRPAVFIEVLYFCSILLLT